ncbi:DUF1365 domain-containing protein [Streptomyces acidiscabies]|uniref:DUF1365 domain-containing protein n=1 Tax=Streptomyces acidiscabies TaxID=42234 RepID=A0AAP6ELB9_9ACTN|nr:DUF1365 domain-containing protein [Streptomyces acidiscabies]MBP5942509.1 DUF1365 domain-containing protein [Streptomyces sp. LBUM 1476]MBZ3917737.1 DUF1365 domain-containing protein [Streptomyces acidiscabies]MDX2967142.1 DUF1365 domain-containing protein [Streptomyces acidiscabies]MDX3023549.1 DUF1365 domain-containing protein [Streptomyces acidiscabies]MDX3789245.1 DUF1365 domain-containing protein [Streptomyces acidiscabies]
MNAALYTCTIRHVRTTPRRYTLRHRTYMWLIDPDRPPRLPLPLRPLARFDPRDHFTGDQPSLRAGLDAFLTGHGIDLEGGPVVMLTHARVFGYVFNPITLYWCHGPDGEPRCVVAEVHNTYGGRHGYLLHPDGTGTARADKELYVSPFFPVDGRYRMRLPHPGPRLGLTLHLDREGGRALTATVHGIRRAVTVPNLLRLAVRHPWSTLAVSAAIRFHGIRLYLRGLPVQPRPDDHRTPENVT